MIAENDSTLEMEMEMKSTIFAAAQMKQYLSNSKTNYTEHPLYDNIKVQ